MLPHPLQPLQPLLRCHGSWGYNPRWHKCRQHPKWSLGEMVSRNQPLPLAWKCPWPFTEKGDDKNEHMQHMCKQRIFASIIFYRYTLNHCVRCTLRHIYLFKLTHMILCSSIYPSISIHIILKTRWIKCRGKYEIYLYIHTIYKFTILNSIVSYCAQYSHAQSISININQYQSISININQYQSIIFMFSIFRYFFALSL